MVDMIPAFEYMGRRIVTLLLENLRKSGVTSTGKYHGSESALAGSLGANMKVSDSGVKIFGDDYWVYVEDGRKRGKMPPTRPIVEWIKWKNLNASKYSGKTYDMKIQSLAFAIAKNIQKKGTMKRYGYNGRGTKFVEKTVSDAFVKNMEDFLARYIENNI